MSALPWRAEPFRVFFPLGVLCAWVGIGHWLLYGLGVTRTYSCQLHGLVQMQAFMMAFAVGFLWTALPRRTGTAPPRPLTLLAAAAGLVTTTGAAVAERWALAEAAYAGVVLVVLVSALARFTSPAAGRRPPATFVLVPIALFHALSGALAIALATADGVPASALRLGRLFVEQGVFLSLTVGVGGLLLPVIAGSAPPPDMGTRREAWKALGYAALGAVICVSLVLEFTGFERAGPLVRAAAVASGIVVAGAARPPGRPGFHRRLVWLAVWLMPVGLVASAAWPTYRVPALHVVFIGGFSLLAFAVATHVALGHLGLDTLARGRPPAVVVLAVAFLGALAARLAADASDTYFEHLSWAAALWIAGSAVWLAFLAPKLLVRRHTPA
jgi:uncharacterized protein involved in response to NO